MAETEKIISAVIGILDFASATLKKLVAVPEIPPVVVPPTHKPINMIYYGWHNTETDTRIINARPEFLVDNSPAGPWKGNVNISIFTQAGIKYFEYIDGGYEGTKPQKIPNDLQSNFDFIKEAAIAGAYGVFIDEVSSNPSATSLAYLKQLSDRAHSLELKVVFNVGVGVWGDSLMALCDFINSSEGWTDTALTASQSKWASRTWLLTQGVTDAGNASKITNAALAKGVRAHYSCTAYAMPLPAWFEDYVKGVE